MDTTSKLSIFVNELQRIHNLDIRVFTERALEDIPDYFFTIPASSTGKYHPSYALGDGGLVRHVKATVRIADELMQMADYSFSLVERDVIFSSLILHDGRKSGEEKQEYTVAEHPHLEVLALQRNTNLADIIPVELFKNICDNIDSHMGQWNKDRDGNVILPAPETKMQKFVHLCDYLASRKCIEINFNV